jgi:HD-like signal output (HDOD) protein
MPAPFTAQQSLDRARTILQSGRGAALPELLKIIETLSLNICEVTISELAELIEKDAVVLAKIITVANTLAHNPGISPLTTLSQAIHQLGYNRIRTIAVSLMLLETAGEASSPEQREAAAQALCAGLIAQSTAEWLGTHDPEFAFACTTLRNFGLILFAAVSAEHYRAAATRTFEIGEAAAFRDCFGLTPLDFTRNLLAAAHLPKEVLRTLRECEPESLADVCTTHDARLFGIVDFSNRFASLTLETGPDSDIFVASLHRLTQRFERLVPGAAEIAKPALHRTEERLRKFTRSAGGRTLPAQNLRRIHLRIRQLTPAAPSAEQPAGPIAAPTTAILASAAVRLSAVPPSERPAPDPRPWESVLNRSRAFEAQPLAATITDPVRAALTVLADEFSAPECWLFRARPETKSLSFACGIGCAASSFPESAAIAEKERSVFGVCLQRDEVVLIHHTADAMLRPYLPPWFQKLPGAPEAFFLVPLRDHARSPALLLVGWKKSRRIAVTPAKISLARRILASALTPGPALPTNPAQAA